MLCNCTECNIRISSGNPWIFGKDYLFCSSTCRSNFFIANPNLENKPRDPYRIPEQTQAIYIRKVPSVWIIPNYNNEPKEVPKEIPDEVPKENIKPTKREVVNYILCNFYRKRKSNFAPNPSPEDSLFQNIF